MYVELFDPFDEINVGSDAMPCWSGDHAGMAFGLDGLESGDYPVRDDAGVWWIAAVNDESGVTTIIDTWIYSRTIS